MLPGPVPVHPRVQQAMNKPMLGHRSPEFRELYVNTVTLCKRYLQTRYDLFILTGSGTVAVEAAVANFVDQDRPQQFTCFINGKFSERLAEIAEKFGANVNRCVVEWGTAITKKFVEECLSKYPETFMVLVCHNETSTGVLNPIEEISAVCRKHNVLFLSDSITSVGGVYVCPDSQDIDIMVTGSQKCIAAAPGLSIITISPKAWQRLPTKRHTYYSDLEIYKANGLKGFTPWTPAITLMYGLEEALIMMLEETEPKRSQRHAHCANLLRIGINALGLEILAKNHYSPLVTAIKTPDSITAGSLREEMAKLDVIVAAGQSFLEGRYIRIATIGVVCERDVLTTIAVLEIALTRLGYSCTGNGIKAVMDSVTQ
ncbi:hypothetical protein LCGC14_2052040 [marine sediment metagenome]